MELGTSIIGILLLCLFIFPVILLSRSGKNKSRKMEKDFFSEVSKNELNIADKDVWNEYALGIDNEHNKIIILDWSGPERVSKVFALKDLKVFESVPAYSELNKKNFNYKKVGRLGLLFQFKESVRPDISVTFFVAGLGQLTDEEIKLFKKWTSIINKKMDSKSINEIKHTA